MIRSRILFLLFASFIALATLATPPASADEKISFEGKTIKMILPTTVGGSTDLAARVIINSLGKYLPGNPTIVGSYMPGGGQGISALNFVAQQVRPDGLTILLSSNAEADPIVYRSSQAHFDPTKFEIVGGIGVGDNILIIRTDALPRLLDKSQPPVTMGSIAGPPRSGMRMTVWGTEFLGWNTKWVRGYPNSPDIVLAMERGEVDMTSFPRFFSVNKLTDTTRFKILYLDGLLVPVRPSGRADADNAPLFTEAMEGKIEDPKMRAAYDYWRASKLFKWLALPPQTPAAIRDVYRAAFAKAAADPEFKRQAEKTIEGYTVLSPDETIKMLTDLASTSDEAIATTDALLRKQGF
jgi:hypothetical protein